MPINSEAAFPRPFDFARDVFAFENETYWQYSFDAAGKMTARPRVPRPTYGHRCFVLTRAARQFFYHVRFDPEQKAPDDAACRRLIRAVIARNPRAPCSPEKQIVFPGYGSLRELSEAREGLLKANCGGAWRSYVLRSHWRMVFHISREHQARTAASLDAALKQNIPPIIHLVKFPDLSINHGMILFAGKETADGYSFQAYDPNTPNKWVPFTFNRKASQFSAPPLHYWSGGWVNIIQIFRTWWM